MNYINPEEQGKERTFGTIFLAVGYLACGVVATILAGILVVLIFMFLITYGEDGGGFSGFTIGVLGPAMLGVISWGVASIVVAVGLLDMREWARGGAIILAILLFWLIPIGPLLGLVVIAYLMLPNTNARFTKKQIQ
ncbi:MAG: hypothetical protein KDI03_22660 [Anaerolineae bacterium]|nr:hypothetical protein [Anaerolineae bacterium]